MSKRWHTTAQKNSAKLVALFTALSASNPNIRKLRKSVNRPRRGIAYYWPDEGATISPWCGKLWFRCSQEWMTVTAATISGIEQTVHDANGAGLPGMT